MGIQIQQVLDEVGWSEGYRVPVANEENRKLECEIEAKLKKKHEITLQLGELKERLNTTEKYLKNVETEKQQNQVKQNNESALLSAHRAQLDAEMHMVRLVSSQRGRLQQETRELQKEAADRHQRFLQLKKDVQARTESLEKMKATVKADRQALTEWEEELARGEEGTGLLERYAREDEKEARDLEVERLRLHAEVDERRRLLRELVTEAQTAQTALERSAQMFRQMHRERQQLVAQWEMSVRELHIRDRDIRAVLDEIASMHVMEAEREETMSEQKRFYENEVNNNRERELKMEATVRTNAMLSEGNAALERQVEELNQALILMKRDLESAGRRLDEDHYNNARQNRKNKEDAATIERTKDAIGALEKRMLKIREDCTTSSDRVREIEEMMKAEEQYLKSLDADMERANKTRLTAESALLKLKREEQLMELEMQAINATKAAIKTRMATLEKNVRRQREVLYNLDFEAQRLEGRILMATGQVDVENKEELETKIQEAEDQLKEKREEHTLLAGQVRQLEDTMRRIQASMAIDEKEVRNLENRREDGLLLIAGGEKLVKAARRRFQEKQVEENLLRLRLRQAEESLSREGDALYTLDKQRIELESLMKERRAEISLHADMLLTKKRCVAEELARLNLEVNSRRLRTEQLRNKYALAHTALGHDEDGRLQDVATVRIQMAQEKYTLQVKGDELDAEIRKAEKEIQALENTLKVLNATNDAYKKNLSAVEEEAPEYEEKKQLEGEVAMILDQMRNTRGILKEQQIELEATEAMFNEVVEEESDVRVELEDKHREVNELEKDLEEQDVKLDRALKQVRGLLRELRGRRRTTDTSFDERDIDLRELTEQNRAALNILLELSVRYPDAEPVIQRYVQERGLELPSEGLAPLGPSRLSMARSSTSLGGQRQQSHKTAPSRVTSSLSLLSSSSGGSAARAVGLGSKGAPSTPAGLPLIASKDSISLTPSIVTIELTDSESVQSESSSATLQSRSFKGESGGESASSARGRSQAARRTASSISQMSSRSGEA